MVTDAERQNALVYPESWSVEVELRGFLVDWLYCELLVIEADVPNLAPGEPDLRCQSTEQETINCHQAMN